MVDLLRERFEADTTSSHSAHANAPVDTAAAPPPPPPPAAAANSAAERLADELAGKIVTGEPFTDRKSTFQVRLAPPLDTHRTRSHLLHTVREAKDRQ